MMTFARKISYGIMLLFLLLVMFLRIGHIVLAGLFAVMILDIISRYLERVMKPLIARMMSVLLFTCISLGFTLVFFNFIKKTLYTFPKILQDAMPKILAIAQNYGLSLPFGNYDELMDILNSKIIGNALAITKVSTILTREVFHVAIILVAAALFFMDRTSGKYRANLFDAVRKEVNARMAFFASSFERVLGAQVLISMINTGLTVLFLSLLGIPHIPFLASMTFIFGMVPVVGNIMSNTVICITALGISLEHAALALLYLILIHKLEYFLNSKIMGSSVNLPMWQMLLAILMGDIIMGVPGIMLAPTILHYIKTELQAIPSPEESA